MSGIIDGGIEDISDDDNEGVDRKEAILSNENRLVDEDTTENKQIIDVNDVSGGKPTVASSTRDETIVDVADGEKVTIDGKVAETSKVTSSDSASKVIAMCELILKILII